MEITRKLLEEKYQFTKCTVCKHIFLPGDSNPCSDEHLIPEFLGGRLKVGILCKQCNNSMGGGFESRTAASFFGKAHANKYQIMGKSRSIPNSPLVGTYNFNGKSVFLDTEFKVRTHPDIQCEVNEDGSITFSGSIDASDLEESKKIITKKVVRVLKQQNNGQQIDEVKIFNQISAYLENAELNVTEKPTIQGNLTVDLNDLDLLFLKIAYEFLCIHFGPAIIDDDFYETWRTTLKTQDIHPDLNMGMHSFFSFFENLKAEKVFPPFIVFNFDEFEIEEKKDNILIIITRQSVFVRCFGFWRALETNIRNLGVELYEYSAKENILRFYGGDEFLLRILDRGVFSFDGLQ